MRRECHGNGMNIGCLIRRGKGSEFTGAGQPA